MQNATRINNMRGLVNVIVDTSTKSTEPALQLSKGIFHNSPQSRQSNIKRLPFLVFRCVEGLWLHNLCRQFKSRFRSTTGTSTPPMLFELSANRVVQSSILFKLVLSNTWESWQWLGAPTCT